ncbi:hypothetical protein SO802_021264 [Lithocarpus litseifolius]|uniref:CobW/HypB/UreG nucleotide-binding domain-containing protein n=1 Tax=Lithocarpus litseifolius TaxID=425828 RepID=A0AAW2CEZ1_9ROSI
MQFGKVDIDGSLVASHSSVSEDVIMVNNGCICCTVREDLIKMLLKLVKEKRDKFDHIVIEKIGLAKPVLVIETFYSDELDSHYLKLDGVVTLIDLKHAMQHLNEVKPIFVVNEAVEQVAYADRIIFNKIDLVSEAELEVLTKKIKERRDTAGRLFGMGWSFSPLFKRCRVAVGRGYTGSKNVGWLPSREIRVMMY